MKREKSEKKTPAQPRVDEMNDEDSRTMVGLGLFLCYYTALKHDRQEEMERIRKALDKRGLTIVKTSDGKHSLVKKEEK